MKVTFLKPGMLSTIQDMGRHLYRAQGIPSAGAMDTLSMRLANLSLGNPSNAAVIEMTYADVLIKAETDLLIAYSGASSVLYVSGKALQDNRPLFIPAGQSLEFKHQDTGSRTYLAVAGGWDVPTVLGSKSTYLTGKFGGLKGRILKKGDSLINTNDLTEVNAYLLSRLKSSQINFTNWSIHKEHFLPPDKNIIRIVPGNEFTWFRADSLLNFLSSTYTLGRNADRMGYHFAGPPLMRSLQTELLSTGVVPGTLQVTHNGSLVLLMADGQTTGGYPRIGQVAQIDLPLCAQLKPGDSIQFSAISRTEAEKLYLKREYELRKLAIAIHMILK